MDLCRNALHKLGAALIVGLGFLSGAVAQALSFYPIIDAAITTGGGGANG